MKSNTSDGKHFKLKALWTYLETYHLKYKANNDHSIIWSNQMNEQVLSYNCS